MTTLPTPSTTPLTLTPTASPSPAARRTARFSASENFGSFGVEWHVPSVFWFIGGVDPDTYAKAEREGKLSEIPTNHNPKFAPVIHPTLETGVETLVTATCAWLAD